MLTYRSDVTFLATLTKNWLLGFKSGISAQAAGMCILFTDQQEATLLTANKAQHYRSIWENDLQLPRSVKPLHSLLMT